MTYSLALSDELRVWYYIFMSRNSQRVQTSYFKQEEYANDYTGFLLQIRWILSHALLKLRHMCKAAPLLQCFRHGYLWYTTGSRFIAVINNSIVRTEIVKLQSELALKNDTAYFALMGELRGVFPAFINENDGDIDQMLSGRIHP